MTIPDFQTLMLPVLKFSASRSEHSLREATDFLADEYQLTQEEREELLPSGTQPIFYNRVGWARTYLKQAGLLEPTRRNFSKITEKGKEVLKQNPDQINMKFLEKFPQYLEFRDRKREKKDEQETAVVTEELSPEEIIRSILCTYP